MKAQHKCHHCKEDFTFPQEVYCISNLKLESGIDGMLHWRWIKDTDKVERIEYWFHRACFLEVAGVLFIGGLKKE